MTHSNGFDVRADMAEQPAAVAAMFARRDELRGQVAELELRDPVGVVLVARGSSDNAATFARYVFEIVLGTPVVLAAPSAYTRYGARPRLDGWLAVAISQSGETPEIVAAVEALRDCGTRVVSVTNDPLSALAATADLVVDLRCGVERAVPATKTVTTSVAALAMLVRAMAADDVPWSRDDEMRAAESLGLVLADAGAASAAGTECLAGSSVTHLARGLTMAAAAEGALKFREMTGRAADWMSPADYLHGPIAATHASTTVVAYTASGPVRADVVGAGARARERGASVLWVGPPDVAPHGRVVPVPDVREHLAVLPMMVRGQQIALAAALAAAVDPDHPPGLEKLTPTT